MGFDGTFAKIPATGGESSLFRIRVPGRGLRGEGKTVKVRTIPCGRPSLFIFGSGWKFSVSGEGVPGLGAERGFDERSFRERM